MSTKKTEKYTLLSGEEVEFPTPTGQLAEFLKSVHEAMLRPNVTAAWLQEYIYGVENPLLDKTILPGRAVVTKAVYENPVWHVLGDLIGRKRVAEGSLNIAAATKRYTMTVPEAASRLGIHESAVRQAIAARRLTSWKHGARHYLAPEEVANYRPSPAGPPPMLRVRVGSSPGARFSIKQVGGNMLLDSPGSPDAAVVGSWKRVAVLAGTKDKVRCWILEPGDVQDEIAFEGFFVRGRFRIVEKINNEVRARETFKAFKAA